MKRENRLSFPNCLEFVFWLVKKYRKLKGLTQAQLAEKIDYSLSFVAGLESKKH